MVLFRNVNHPAHLCEWAVESMHSTFEERLIPQLVLIYTIDDLLNTVLNIVLEGPRMVKSMPEINLQIG